jgi:hypothetical protein
MFSEKELKEWCVKNCVKNCVKLQTSPPYHHASNGLPDERGIQTVMNKTRTIKSQHY